MLFWNLSVRIWQHTHTLTTQLVFPAANSPKIYYTYDEGLTFQVQSFTPPTINPRSLLFNPTQSSWAIGHDNTNDKVAALYYACSDMYMYVFVDIRSQLQLSNIVHLSFDSSMSQKTWVGHGFGFLTMLTSLSTISGMFLISMLFGHCCQNSS